jgi:hypothetical protein
MGLDMAVGMLRHQPPGASICSGVEVMAKRGVIA